MMPALMGAPQARLVVWAMPCPNLAPGHPRPTPGTLLQLSPTAQLQELSSTLQLALASVPWAMCWPRLAPHPHCCSLQIAGPPQ